MTRELRIGVAIVAALGALVFGLLILGSLGSVRPEVDPLAVEEALAGGQPADEWGTEELHVAGWYAELDADCTGDDGGADASAAWLQRDCPLRVLLPEQPADDVTQDELLRDGLRLAAPLGNAFPSRAEPTGPNLRGQQLVFVGHFADATATSCVPERVERCRATFVVTDYDELVR
ncbi:MAG: hypothetical protein QOI85_943 [Chloroflexota bacterium]|jgi:hypothetical protein|nr:hypothetical protein [Chloroflexota bacterium]